MSGDKLKDLAGLMRAAYPGRDSWVCLERAQACLDDIAEAHMEYQAASSLASYSCPDDAGGRHEAIHRLYDDLRVVFHEHVDRVRNDRWEGRS